MIDEKFVILGTIIGAIGTLSYFIDTLRGKIRPNRVSFLFWSLAPLIAFAAQVYEGVGIQSLMTFSVGFFPLTIFLASFVNKKAEWKLNKFDLACGIFSLIGLVLWYVTKIGNVAIAFGLIADGFASLPTIRKSFYYPETENAWPWLTPSANAAITLLTIRTWDFATASFPVYIFFVNLIIFSLVQFRLGKLVVDTRSRA